MNFESAYFNSAKPNAFMKTIRYSTLLLGLFLGGATALPAQVFNSGSDGSYGPLNVTSNTVLDLPPDGVFHCTTITVDANVLLLFNRNALNTPVYLLAQSNVVINGYIEVSGVSRDGVIFSNAGRGGPGGFDGGFGFVQGYAAGDGQGPGAGRVADAPGGVFAFPSGANSNVYGNTLLSPLVGGSGGAGSPQPNVQGIRYDGGGGGGGALLIASSTSIALNNTRSDSYNLYSSGGHGYGYSGGGSGGALRLVAPVVQGNGRISVAGGGREAGTGYNGTDGRIRIDTLDRFAWRNLGFVNGKWSIGSQMYVFPPGNPRLNIVEAAGQTVAEGTNAPVIVSLPPGSSTNQVIKVKAAGFTGSVPVTVAVVPEAGPSSRFDGVITVIGGNPTVGNINVVIPVDSFCNIKVWTR